MIIRGVRYLFCDCDHDVKFHDNPEDILTTFKPGYYKDGVPVYGLCKDSSGMVSWLTKSQKITLKWINRPSKLSYCQVMTSCYECTGTCSSSVKTFVWSHFDKQQTILANMKILFSFCFWLYTNILTLGAWCLQIFLATTYSHTTGLVFLLWQIL